MGFFNFKLHYWPILSTVWGIGTYFISYAIAISNNHVSKFLPFISDTGATPIESCIFGQMLNMSAALLFVVMFIRQKIIYMDFSNEKNYSTKILTLNRWSYPFGIIGCLGMTIVANFQETTQLVVHFFGAFLIFFIGPGYFILQSIISLKTDISTLTKCTRLFISSISIPIFITTITTASISISEFHGTNKLMWGENDGGYELHLVSTSSEWIMAILLHLYVLTLTNDFKNVKYEGVKFSPRFPVL